jgi:hypothetical protein
VGVAAQPEQIVLQLPTGLQTFEKKLYVSKGWGDIFKKISPFSLESEKKIIGCLVAELNAIYNCNLATELIFERESSAAAAGDSTSTVILVGASHANNLALALGEHFDIATVEMKSWRPNPGTVTDAEESLKRPSTATPTLRRWSTSV